MTQPTSIIKCEKSTDLHQLGVAPGWYVRYACCSIWFEVTHVFEGMVLCVARDPKKGTELAHVGDFYSAINEFCTGKPGGGAHWIAADRAKNFYDKFFPEPDKIVKS
ncbi:TPA: hypothetical protein ACP32N_005045 [Pseudomonas aeruginosa]